jgi:hypothetical protein
MWPTEIKLISGSLQTLQQQFPYFFGLKSVTARSGVARRGERCDDPGRQNGQKMNILKEKMLFSALNKL